MQKNILAVLAILLSAIALVVSIFAISKVSKIEEQITNSGSVQTIPEHVNEESMNEGEVETLNPTHPFDANLVGDWSGTLPHTTQFVRMRVLEDSTLLIESQDRGNVFLYIGYIENGVNVIEKRVRLVDKEGYNPSYFDVKIESYEPGSGIEEYMNNPGSMETEDYAVARYLSQPTKDSVLINFGLVQSSAGEITATLTRQ